MDAKNLTQSFSCSMQPPSESSPHSHTGVERTRQEDQVSLAEREETRTIHFTSTHTVLRADAPEINMGGPVSWQTWFCCKKLVPTARSSRDAFSRLDSLIYFILLHVLPLLLAHKQNVLFLCRPLGRSTRPIPWMLIPSKAIERLKLNYCH